MESGRAPSRRGLLAGAVLLAFGSMGADARPRDAVEGAMRRAVEDIRTSYVDPVPLDALLRDGLAGVARADLPLDAAERRALAEGTAALARATSERERLAAYVRAVGAAGRREALAGDVVAAALRGMAAGRDAESRYDPPAPPRPARPASAAASVGLEAGTVDGAITVVRPLPNGPAARGGLRSGDRILAVDGRPTAGSRLLDVFARLRGPAGSEVTLAIAPSSGGPTRTVALRREEIPPTGLRWALMGRTAYLRPETFRAETGSEMRAALRTATERAGALDGVVLDLRENPGGLLDAAGSVAGVFLPVGETVASLVGRGRGANHTLGADGDAVPGLPVAVVVNAATAAGAEIVAGALQDHRRALVLGERTFGRGTVQSVIAVPATGGHLYLTMSRIVRSSGQPIEGVGVRPDIRVRGSEGATGRWLLRAQGRPVNERPDEDGRVPRPDLPPLGDVPDRPPPGEPPPDPSRPEADFEIRQAAALLARLRP